MFRYLIIFLIPLLGASITSSAEDEKEPEITAQLRFTLWVNHKAQGIQSQGNSLKKQKPIVRYKGNFFIKDGEKFTSLSYRQGRQTKEFIYKGDHECIVYKKGLGDMPYAELFKIVLPKSGKYLVILKTTGSVESPRFRPLLIPHNAENLSVGHILFINATKQRLGFVLDDNKKMVLKPSGIKSLALSDKESAGIHLKVYAKRKADSAWTLEDSKGYSLDPDKKSACIFYRDSKLGRIKLKLFSGIE